MNDVTDNKLVSILLNESTSYERMLDISTDELEFLKNECDIIISGLKQKILHEYEIIRPALEKMREWKEQLKKIKQKREMYKTFISLDGTSSMISVSSLHAQDLRGNNGGHNEDRKESQDRETAIRNALSGGTYRSNTGDSTENSFIIPELFREIETTKLYDGIQTPPRDSTSAFSSFKVKDKLSKLIDKICNKKEENNGSANASANGNTLNAPVSPEVEHGPPNSPNSNVKEVNHASLTKTTSKPKTPNQKKPVLKRV